MQKEIMEEEKEFRYPLPFNLEEAKGIKIKEEVDTWADELAKSKGLFWGNNTYLEISNIPIGTKIYTPTSTPSEGYLIWDNSNERDDYYILSFDVNLPPGKELFRSAERTDPWRVDFKLIGVRLLPAGIEQKVVSHGEGGTLDYFNTDAELGAPVAEVISKEYLNDKYWDWGNEKEVPSDPSNEPSILIDYLFSQSNNPEKYLWTGLENLLTLSKEKILVFTSPAHD